MEDVVLLSGVRTAIGTFGGSLSETPASDLAAAVIRESVIRAGVAPEQVDHVILGCVGQVAEDGYISRHAAVKAGLPIETPAYTVNRICGSGLEAINTGARWLQTGDAEVVVAGGAENMSMLPFYLRKARYGYRYGHDQLEDGTMHLLTDPFDSILMGETAENPGRAVRGLPRRAGRVRGALPGARPRRHRRRVLQGPDAADGSAEGSGDRHLRH